VSQNHDDGTTSHAAGQQPETVPTPPARQWREAKPAPMPSEPQPDDQSAVLQQPRSIPDWLSPTDEPRKPQPLKVSPQLTQIPARSALGR
jgi:hypothetical protein